MFLKVCEANILVRPIFHFIEKREKDLGMEILAIKIARTNLDFGAATQAVYLQTKEFLSKLKT